MLWSGKETPPPLRAGTGGCCWKPSPACPLHPWKTGKVTVGSSWDGGVASFGPSLLLFGGSDTFFTPKQAPGPPRVLSPSLPRAEVNEAVALLAAEGLLSP